MRAFVEDDLPLMLQWKQAPHLQPFYVRAEAQSLPEDAHAKHAVRARGETPVHPVIASKDGRPFGYLQWYLNRDLPEYGAGVINRSHGVSLDCFIGEPRAPGNGFGAAMLRLCVRRAAAGLTAPERVFFVGHDVTNGPAIACSRHAGFRPDGRHVEDGQDCLLMVREVA
ncbi:MAG: GNAT family N-acetyltransferase [Pseudomonadota bacterium]